MEDRATSPIPSRAQSPLTRSRATSPISPLKRQNPLRDITISALKYIGGPIIGSLATYGANVAYKYYQAQQQKRINEQNRVNWHNENADADPVPKPYGSL